MIPCARQNDKTKAPTSKTMHWSCHQLIGNFTKRRLRFRMRFEFIRGWTLSISCAGINCSTKVPKWNRNGHFPLFEGRKWREKTNQSQFQRNIFRECILLRWTENFFNLFASGSARCSCTKSAMHSFDARNVQESLTILMKIICNNEISLRTLETVTSESNVKWWRWQH